MADKVIVFEGKPQVFPADFTDAEISAALGAIPASNAAHAPTAKTWTSPGMDAAAAGRAVPAAANAAMEVATNPAVPRAAAAVGRAVGAVGPAVGEVAAGNPAAAVALAANAGKSAWAGGKAGYFTGKLAQQAAGPVANVLEKVAPYAQALTTIGGAQSALDLAKMVPGEQGRKDIGVLGMTTGDPGDPDHPALLNLLAGKVTDAVKYLVSMGIPQGEATRVVMNARVKNGSK